MQTAFIDPSLSSRIINNNDYQEAPYRDIVEKLIVRGQGDVFSGSQWEKIMLSLDHLQDKINEEFLLNLAEEKFKMLDNYEEVMTIFKENLGNSTFQFYLNNGVTCPDDDALAAALTIYEQSKNLQTYREPWGVGDE